MKIKRIKKEDVLSITMMTVITDLKITFTFLNMFADTNIYLSNF